MAETKTTIPVEIKMGNAGTNDANLPAFKEGSIIFTKDTKKIYIDPVGETERIAVGCGEVDLNKKQDKFADLDYVWDGDSFEYLSLNLKNATKKISSTGGSRPITGGVVSIVSDLRLSTETGNRVYLTVGAITVDPIDNGRYSSGLSNTFLKFKDREASATLPSMLITPTAHNGTTPAYLTFASPAQNTAVGNANVRLTGIAAPTADNDAANKKYIDTIETKITNSKVGQKLEGGEIFNDYEHNKTFGEGTSARGLNTQAGTLARKIVANGITNIVSGIRLQDMYLITVSGLVNSDELCTDAWVATDSYVEGTSDLVTVDCSTHLSNAFYISKIEENSETNTTAITIKKVDDRVVPILTMDDITGANREEDWIYVPGKLNGEISPQFTSAFAGGKNSVATGFAAMSFGRDNISAGNYSVTLGRGNKASYGGLAAGVYNEAGNYGTALGNSNKALGDNSVATGVGTYARAASSRAGGRYSIANSEYSVAEGLHVVTHASTPAQVVFGSYNRADNNSLFIIGNGTSDTQRSNAFEIRQNGSVWVLNGTERLATISDVNTKPGRISPNNGTLLSIYAGYTNASGNYSLASGYSKATAPYSTALGWGTASEQYAFSTGYDTMSEGFASASFGYKTKADSHSQFVVGRYNKSVSNALFIVGNGSDGSRFNAFEVYNDGHAEVQTMGTTDNSVVIKAYVDTETAKKQGKFADISYGNNITTNDKLVLTPNVDNAISEVYFNIDGASDWKMGTKAVSAPYFKTKNGYIIANTSSMPPILMSNVTTQATTPIINFESAANNNATILRGIADGLNDNDAVNVSQLVKKQDKITNTTDLTVKSITALGVLKAQAYAPLDGQPSFQVFSGTIGQSSMLTFSDKKVMEFKKDSQAFGPSPMPVLGVATPISAADTTLGITDEDLPYQAVNKKYVDDIKTELLNAITHPYTYDETTKELTLIL